MVIGRHVFGLMVLLSVTLHAGAALWFSRAATVEDVVPPTLLPTRVGKASLRVRAQLGARPRKVGDGAPDVAATISTAELPPLPSLVQALSAPARPANSSRAQLPTPRRTPLPAPTRPVATVAGPKLSAETKSTARTDLPNLPLPPLPIPSAPNNNAERPGESKAALPTLPRRTRVVTPTPRLTPNAKLAGGPDLPALAGVALIADFASVPSRGSVGSEGVNGDTLPQMTPVNQPPPYPPEALANRTEGTPVVLITIDATGAVTAATLSTSSGDQALDRSAVEAVRRWRFDPARRRGVPIEYQVRKPIEFFIRR